MLRKSIEFENRLNGEFDLQIDRDRYLTMLEASHKSGYSYAHIRRLVKSGVVAVLEIDNRFRLIDYEDLQRYIHAKPQRKPHSDKKAD